MRDFEIAQRILQIARINKIARNNVYAVVTREIKLFQNYF